MKTLLTNDDGIDAEGLRELRRALLEIVPGIDLLVVAPDGNRSALARSITTRRPLRVRAVDFGDGGAVGYACDGTPVDCVRLANLGLVEGWRPDLIVSGINHGANLGDDITYSGTVAAALEGVILGIPGIAASQQSLRGGLSLVGTGEFIFAAGARFIARLVSDLDTVDLPPATLLNVNFPGREAVGVAVTRLGRRIYGDELSLVEEEPDGARLYRIYGDASPEPGDSGTDTAAVDAGEVAITPLHFDLTHHPSLEPLSGVDLQRLLADPA